MVNDATLPPRERAVLDHIFRYRLTVRDALEQLECFSGAGKHAVANTLRVLSSKGLVKSAPLGVASHRSSTSYYYATTAAARRIAEPEHLAGWLKDWPRARAYAILAFCFFGKVPRERLRPDEFKEAYPGCFRQGETLDYYLDQEGDRPRLGALRVVGRSRWSMVLANCRKDIRKRCAYPALRDLVVGGGFVLTLLVALERQAERYRFKLEHEQLACDVRVEVVPGLLDLLAPAPSSSSAQGG